ncbi:hypothetical protein OV203_17550 [Nannocystis sp. ILAH1]|uniref:hypothetical protein n=1 Tax=Nannocystis sp. ILAH1 TaxID=2996789 RepID=UPI00226D4AFE|nr:hypothetical protein [Nannocystis sp. ILAH1]MCY0988945.1 hypothetical protein [Nannocystis sp. ILAH1]
MIRPVERRCRPKTGGGVIRSSARVRVRGEAGEDVVGEVVVLDGRVEPRRVQRMAAPGAFAALN